MNQKEKNKVLEPEVNFKKDEKEKKSKSAFDGFRFFLASNFSSSKLALAIFSALIYLANFGNFFYFLMSSGFIFRSEKASKIVSLSNYQIVQIVFNTAAAFLLYKIIVLFFLTSKISWVHFKEIIERKTDFAVLFGRKIKVVSIDSIFVSSSYSRVKNSLVRSEIKAFDEKNNLLKINIFSSIANEKLAEFLIDHCNQNSPNTKIGFVRE